jgi:DNA end-binding protein Ku
VSRALWTGSITFGLVNIPVKLRTAVRDSRPRFRLLHRKDNSPVEYQRVCRTEGTPVAWEDLVKGYEYEKGHFVVLTKEDFETAALEKSRAVEILDFVEEREIDDRFFDTPYYVEPAKGADHAYVVLREALRRTARAGIGRIVLRQVQHLAAVTVVEDALVLSLLRFADELVDVSTLTLPGKTKVAAKEMKLAETLIENLASPWKPEQYRDEYRENLMRIIAARRKGRKATMKVDEPERSAKVVDLMERLRQSLEQTKRSPRRSSKRKRTKKVA